ncbi:HEPN/Toprim-associated domain-containing protein [Pseudomonadota bacterium]
MGSIAELYFSEYPVNETKNYLDQWIFKGSDKRVFQRKLSERSELVWGKDEEDDEEETAYVFEAPTSTIINRLEVLGYTLEACKNNFERRVKEEITKLKDVEEHDSDFVRKQRELYSKYGRFEQWLDAFKIIVTEKPKEVGYFSEPEKVHDNELVNYMLNPPDIWNEDLHPIGFEYPCLDFNIFARVFLEVCEQDSLVQLDATDLVLGGWYEGFEHLEDIVKPNTRFFSVLSESLSEIEALVADGDKYSNELLMAKLLYANVITAFEAYLSDTFIYTVVSFPPLIRRIVETDPEFSKRKLDVSDLFRRHDGIRDEVANYLEGLIYHNLSKVKQLYKSVLCVDFPKDLSAIFKAINIRHDLVHRNGRNKEGEGHRIKLEAVIELITSIRIFVDNIDTQVKNVYPGMLERDF